MTNPMIAPATIGQQFDRRLNIAVAQQYVKDMALGQEAPYLYPQPQDERDKTAQAHTKRMKALAKKTADTIWENRFGKEPSETFFQRWLQHDIAGDLIAGVDPMTGQPDMGQWLQDYYFISGYRADLQFRKYINLKAQRERELARQSLITDASMLEVG